MARALRALVWTMGIACVAIGLAHVLAGNAVLPGEEHAGATIDSWGRFMGAVFAGYGAAWIRLARQATIPSRSVRWLAGVFLLGGAGRLLSLAATGWPGAFQAVLAALELGLPPVYFWLADADERRGAA